jgi:amino acid transporter
MRRVDPRTHTPVPATILIVVIGVILMAALPGAAQLELITASTILPAIVYGATIVLHLAVRKRLDRKKGAFDLGRFELPVAIGALTWSAVGSASSACWCSTGRCCRPSPVTSTPSCIDGAHAVAEGFEPPDGFSRLSLSRRVH